MNDGDVNDYIKRRIDRKWLEFPIFIRSKKKRNTPLLGFTLSKRKYEDHSYILGSYQMTSSQKNVKYVGRNIVQLLGEAQFTLLEGISHIDAKFNSLDRMYVGKKGRTKIEKILGRIKFKQLTDLSKSNLRKAIWLALEKKEYYIVNLFNNAPLVSENTHVLERLGLTKTQLFAALQERQQQPFGSYNDIVDGCGISFNKLRENLVDRVVYEIGTYT